MSISKKIDNIPEINIPKIEELDLYFPKEYELLATQAIKLLQVCESITEQYVAAFKFYSVDSKVALSKRECQLWNTILVNAQTDKTKLGSEDKRKQVLAELKNSDLEYQQLLQLNIDASCNVKRLEQAKGRYDFLLYMTQQSMKATDHSQYVESKEIVKELTQEDNPDWLNDF